MSEIPNTIVFVFPVRMTAGGMPDDTRQFIAAISQSHDGHVVLMSVGTPSDDAGILENTELVDLEVQHDVDRILAQLDPMDITVFITFSSLLNVRLAKRLRKQNLRYSVLPAWQIHQFLDWDRPFPRGAVPIIHAIENNPKQFNSAGAGGVVEGKLTLRGFFRSIMRKTYRKTLGRNYIQNASGIHVFSELEQSKICKLIKPKDASFLDITYGANVEGRSVGEDRYPKNGKKNIVFWGRADYYYKGLDNIIEGIALAKEKGISVPFTFWVCGPDYNEGYRKLQDHAAKRQVLEHVQILARGDYTPGTIGLLKRADFAIIASRWDGHARTLRECATLGVPFLSSRETHFDKVVDKFGNGVLFDDVHDIANIFANLDGDATTKAKKAAIDNVDAAKKYFSWEECAKRFLDSLKYLRA